MNCLACQFRFRGDEPRVATRSPRNSIRFPGKFSNQRHRFLPPLAYPRRRWLKWPFVAGACPSRSWLRALIKRPIATRAPTVCARQWMIESFEFPGIRRRELPFRVKLYIFVIMRLPRIATTSRQRYIGCETSGWLMYHLPRLVPIYLDLPRRWRPV